MDTYWINDIGFEQNPGWKSVKQLLLDNLTRGYSLIKVKVRTYKALYPVLGTAQGALVYTSPPGRPVHSNTV